jgi:hypothetical protein
MHRLLSRLIPTDTLKRELQPAARQIAAAHIRHCLVGLLICCASFGLGCKQSAAEAAGHSDANGYFCRGCKAKFFTKRSVFAARCPSCRSVDLAPVVGFLCDKDGHTTLTTSRDDPVACEQCQTRLANIRLPHEKELRAWGAEQKNKKDVTP